MTGLVIFLYMVQPSSWTHHQCASRCIPGSSLRITFFLCVSSVYASSENFTKNDNDNVKDDHVIMAKDLHSLSSIVGELYLKTCSIILPILPIASSRPVHSTRLVYLLTITCLRSSLKASVINAHPRFVLSQAAEYP